MDYFNNKDNVMQYIKMVEAENNEYILNEIFINLKHKTKLLELGMGAGKEFEILKKEFDIIGSDKSNHFLDEYRKKDPEAKLVNLDAVTLDIDEKFDYIYSNKVLIHLNNKELKTSFKNQSKILNEHGQLFHTFWKNTGCAIHDGLYFNYQTKISILKLATTWYDIVKYQEYSEIEENDSFYIILQKKADKNNE